MFRNFMAALGLTCLATSSYANPITITQTYNNAYYDDYGVASGVGFGQMPSAPWIFRGTVDSDAFRMSIYPGYNTYVLTSLTVTQASLGLFDVPIVNVPTLYFSPFSFGFSNDRGVSTRIIYDYNVFAGATQLEDDLALIATPSIETWYSSFDPQWEGFELADGRSIYGSGGRASEVAVEVASVPEPTSLALALAALGVVNVRSRRRRAS